MPGEFIDIVLTPEGTDGSHGDGNDSSNFGALIFSVPEPSRAILLLGGLGAFLIRRRR